MLSDLPMLKQIELVWIAWQLWYSSVLCAVGWRYVQSRRCKGIVSNCPTLNHGKHWCHHLVRKSLLLKRRCERGPRCHTKPVLTPWATNPTTYDIFYSYHNEARKWR